MFENHQNMEKLNKCENILQDQLGIKYPAYEQIGQIFIN